MIGPIETDNNSNYIFLGCHVRHISAMYCNYQLIFVST